MRSNDWECSCAYIQDQSNGDDGSFPGNSFSNISISFATLFAYMLGDFDLEDFAQYDNPVVAVIMFMVFEIVMALIVLNLLIALMTEAYQRVSTQHICKT